MQYSIQCRGRIVRPFGSVRSQTQQAERHGRSIACLLPIRIDVELGDDESIADAQPGSGGRSRRADLYPCKEFGKIGKVEDNGVGICGIDLDAVEFGVGMAGKRRIGPG